MLAEDEEALQRLIETYGAAALRQELTTSSANDALTLTIVANAGLHPLPTDFIKGELYIASEGNLDFSTTQTVEAEINKILSRVRKKLKEKRWASVLLVPFGHSVVSMNIKMAVFRTIRIETVDLFYFGEGRYGEVAIDTRALMLEDSREG